MRVFSRNSREVRAQVAVVTPYYPPVTGGAENQIQLLVRGLLRKGIGVHLFTSALPLPAEGEKCRLLRVTKCQPARSGPSSWREDLLEKLDGLTAMPDAAIVQLSSIHPDAAADAAIHLRDRGVKVAVRISSQGRFGAIDPARRKSLVQRGCLFVVHSPALVKDIISLSVPRGEVIVIPNAVLPSLNTVKPNTSGIGGRKRILFVGRLDPKKRLDLLIDAWKVMEPCFPTAELIIVGSEHWEIWKGKERILPMLLSRARQAGLKRLTFLCEKPRAELSELYCSATLAVSSSENEGMSNFILEAMAVGLPIVCSDIVANDFIREGRNGWRFKNGSSSSLAEVLETALSQESRKLKKMGVLNQCWVSSDLSLERVVRLYLEAFEIRPPNR